MPTRLEAVKACLLALGLLGAAPVQAQMLELAVDASPAGLDPHIATAFASFQIFNGTIFEGLTAIDGSLGVQPGLAESWTVSDSGKRYTFKIRSGVTFHDGSPFTAQDAAASLRRILSKDIGSPLASRLASVDSIVAKDDTTLEIVLREPSAPLLASLATLAMVPRSLESDKERLQRAPVGTGPFRFAEWRPNGFIRLDRNDSYWRAGEPKLAGLRFNIVPEAATRQVGLLNGQYAVLPNIDAATAQQLRGKPHAKLSETLDLAYTLVGMNTSKPPFDNAKVREALNYALNRQEIIEAALFGAGAPAGPLSPALRDWSASVSSFPCYRPDPAKAQALLKEAGVTTPVAVTMNVLPRQDVRDIAQVVQEQLNKAGFKVELKNQELGQFIQDWRNSNFDLFVSVNAGGVDPDEYFYRTFRTAGSTNVFKYSNAALDSLLDRARASADRAARKADYDEAQKILACSGPAAHLAYGTLFTASRDAVRGFEGSPTRSLSTLRAVTLASP